MANTTLCGYVSYGTNVEKNEDDSELYLDCQINLDNNGTEKPVGWVLTQQISFRYFLLVYFLYSYSCHS